MKSSSALRLASLAATLLLAATPLTRAATYDVGPAAGQLTHLSDVPWRYLQPGDLVNIHPTPGGYHEIIQISAAGTAAQPILIRGIPDPVTQALPVIDGDGAVMDPHVDFRNAVFENLGVLLVTPRAAGYIYGKTFPAYITIESLAIRNALYDPTGVLHFTDQHGATRIYNHFACGIYVEFARHLTIRGCEISFNGNGLFANSKNGPAQASADLLIEKNYFHDNGQPTIPGVTNGYAEHNIYVESVGAVYQFNRFGPLRAGCHGCMIKDRSSGTVIRYNDVSSTEASEMFAILDPQGGAGYIDQQPDYRDAFVYGNTITLLNSGFGGAGLVWFAACNGVPYYPTQHRGTLYFYHNTVVNHQPGTAGFFLTDPIYAGTPNIAEKVDARNNLFFTDSAIQANVYQAFHFAVVNTVTTMDFGANWVSPGTQQNWYGHSAGTIFNGWANLVVGDFAGKNNAGFANLAGSDYHLVNGSDAIDAAGPLAPAALAKGYLADQEYVVSQSAGPRLTLGAGPDLGAFETSATYVPPPLNHAPVVQPVSLNVIGSAPVAFTLAATDADHDPLTFTYTTVGIIGTISGTAPNLTYTPPATGRGTLICGFLANDGQVNSTAGYIYISFNSAGNTPPAVALTTPAANLTVSPATPVALAASASDSDGIKRVDFFVGPTLVGSATAAPYTFNWSSATPGRFQVVAKAYDNLNASTYTQPVFVTVQ